MLFKQVFHERLPFSRYSSNRPRITLEWKHWTSAMGKVERRHIGAGTTGCVYTNEAITDFPVGGDGCVHSFGDQNIIGIRVDPELVSCTRLKGTISPRRRYHR